MDASDLRAFEAVTRLGGMNRAAAELAGALLAPPIAQRHAGRGAARQHDARDHRFLRLRRPALGSRAAGSSR